MHTKTCAAAAACLTVWTMLAWGDAEPVARDAALVKFQRTIVFYAGFEGTANADLSPLAGAPAVPLAAGLQPFVPGMIGQALSSGNFDLSYDLGKEARIERAGSAAIWVAARQSKPDYTYFWPFKVHGNHRLIMLGRMGDRANDCALYAYTSFNDKGTSSVAGSASGWKEGQWHLLVVNWGPDWVELSVDGNAPTRAAAPLAFREPTPDKLDPARLSVSSPRPSGDQFLLDEMMVFSTPLGAAEIQWLYENSRTAAIRPAQPPATTGTAPATRTAATGTADDYHVPQLRLPLMMQPPKIDGRVDEQEWAGAPRMEGFCGGQRLEPRQASFWVGSDGKELFIAMISQTPPGGRLLSRVNPAPGDRDAPAWLDDSVEVTLESPRVDTAGRRQTYRATINAKGAIDDQCRLSDGGVEPWRGHWRLASQVVGDRWHFEAVLPLADVQVGPEDILKPFGLAIARNWKQCPLPGRGEWGPLGGIARLAQTMPEVTWDPRAPVVQTLQLRDAGKSDAHVVLSVFNPTATEMELAVTIRCRPRSSAPRDERAAITLASGQTRRVECGAPALNEDVAVLTQVTSKDGKTTYYLRDFLMPPPAANADLWTVDAEAARKAELNFAYYPYHNRARVRVDASSLLDRTRITGVALRIAKRGGGPALAETTMPPLKEPVCSLDWPLPALGEGEYELTAAFQGITAEPMKTVFVRHVMPWEHNKLGKSDVVVSPFTPIKVEGGTVSTVLREHTVDDLGLWRQVAALGKPLLKGPMRLEIVQGGQRHQVVGKGISFVSKSDTKVIAQGKWSCAGLNGGTRSEWDYDGLMKWALTLEPGPQKIESMTLVIPLDDRLMPLFHACTDGIRFNYAGRTPAGARRIWDGTKAPRNSIIGSYVPYIWLGAEERGLAVFGENDKGWVTDPKVPCQELVRTGESLELRLNLIAQETVIDRPRQILIGFQATPVKPLPADWRRWTMAQADRPVVRNFSFVGSCWSWGAETPACDIYPRGGDLRVWDQYRRARQTGRLDERFAQEWIKGFQADTAEARRQLEIHNTSAFAMMKNQPQRVLAYTNARGVRFDTPEGQTFLNEWHRDLFPQRLYPWPHLANAVAYDLNPCASYRDYALWYYKRMYETFVDAIYWDDIFLQSVFHTVDTEAYELPDGRIQPAAGLFDMRELIRRTAVLCHELGKPNANMPHITNTAIAPVLAFAGAHYTWEDRAGDADFQDRFPRDYLRVESIGLQAGNVPFGMLLIPGVTDKAKQAWIERTATGMALTHEVKLQGGPWSLPIYCASLDKLFEYGYGKPEVKVYRYWDEAQPVAVAGGDTTTLVCAKPGSALIVVCDWGKGGDLAVKLDRRALDLTGELQARDMEDNKPLPVEDATVRLEMKKHDFKIVLVQSAAAGR